MNKTLLASVLALSIGGLLAAPSAQAAVINGGFETGNLAGWVTNGGSAGAATSYGAFTPTKGVYLGWVKAGLGANVYTTLSQTIKLSLGDTVSGIWGFQAQDYLPYNDDGYLSINGYKLLSSNVSAVGTNGNTGWTAWSYIAPTSGNYTLQIGVENKLDNMSASGVVLDAVVTSAVPEPASMALLGAGLVGVGVIRRRRT